MFSLFTRFCGALLLLCFPFLLTAQSDLSISISTNQTTFVQWTNVTYKVVIYNNGPAAATGVVVNIPVGPALAYTSNISSQGAYDLFFENWTIGNMAAGEKDSIQIVLFMKSPSATTIFAQVFASNSPDPNSTPNNNTGVIPTENDEAAVTLLPGAGGGGGGDDGSGGATTADLSLAITSNASAYNFGSPVPFIIKLTNVGPGNAGGIKVKVQIPPGLLFSSATSVIGSYNATTGIWDIGNVNSGGDRTLLLNCLATLGGPSKLFAQVTSSSLTDPDSAPNNNNTTTPVQDDEAALTIDNQQVDMELNLSLAAGQSSDVAVNDNVTFVVTVNNVGTSLGENTKIRCILPTGFQYVSNTTLAGAYNTALGVWIIGNVPAGSTQVLELTAKVVNAGPLSFICEVRTVNQPDFDSTPSNFLASEDDQDEVIITTNGLGSVNADVSVTLLASPTNVVAGGNTTLTLHLNNVGPAQATGVTVSFPLPVGLNISSTTTTLGSFANGVWTLGDINSGAAATLTVFANVPLNFTEDLVLFAQVQTATSADPNSTPGNDLEQTANENDEAKVILTPAITTPTADLSLSLTSSIAVVASGGTVSFVLQVANSGSFSAAGVSVTLNLPIEFTINSSLTSTGSFSNGVWTIGNLASGAMVSLNLATTANITAATKVFAQIQTATTPDPDSAPGNDTDQSVNEDDEASVTVNPTIIPSGGNADLSLALTASNNTPPVYTNVTLSLVVTNNGPNNATGVKTKFVLPQGYAFVSATTLTGSYEAWTGDWNVGALANGASAILNVALFTLSTTHVNFFGQVQASGNADPDSTPGNDTSGTADEDDEAAITLPNVIVVVQPKKCDLALTILANKATFVAGDTIVYTLTVSNTGDTTAYGTSVKTVLNSNITLLSANSANFTGTTWTIGTLPMGSSTSLQLTTKAGVGTDNILQFAQVQTASPLDSDSSPGNNTSNAVNEDDESSVTILSANAPPTADVALDVTATPTALTTDGNFTLTLLVSNAGPSPATVLSTKLNLPVGVSIATSSTATGTYNNDIWTIGTLANGASATLTLNGTANIISPASIFAQLQTADETDPDSAPGNDTNQTANEDDEDKITLTPPIVVGGNADLSLVLVASTNTPAVYTNVTVSAEVTNNGPSNATGVKARFALPQGFAFVAATTLNGAYEAWTGDWNIGALAVGATATLNIELFTLATAPVNFFAQVQASGQNDPDSTPGNDTNSSANEDDEAALTLPNDGTGVTPPKKCDLSLTLNADKTTFAEGDTIVYTLKVTNTADTSAAGVTVKFNLNPGLSLLSSSSGGFSGNIWTLGAVPAAGSATLQLVTLASASTTALVQFAQIQTNATEDSDSSPGNDTNNSANEDDEAAVTIFPLGGGNTIDLALSMNTSSTYAIYVTKDFTLTVTNTGFVPADDIVVAFPFPEFFVYTDNVANQGAYDIQTKLWTVGSLGVGQSAQLVLTLFNLNNSGPINGFAQIATAAPVDSDSEPGNNTDQLANEDDEVAFTILPGLGLQAPSENSFATALPALTMSPIWPNPTTGPLSLFVDSPLNANAKFVITNNIGQVLHQFDVALVQGRQTVEIQGLSTFPAGLYYLHCIDNQQLRHTFPFVKL